MSIVDARLDYVALVTLLALEQAGGLTTAHVLVGGVQPGRVGAHAVPLASAGPGNGQRWAGRPGALKSTRICRRRLAFWRGNVSAVYRELAAAATAGGPSAPSMATLEPRRAT